MSKHINTRYDNRPNIRPHNVSPPSQTKLWEGIVDENYSFSLVFILLFLSPILVICSFFSIFFIFYNTYYSFPIYYIAPFFVFSCHVLSFLSATPLLTFPSVRWSSTFPFCYARSSISVMPKALFPLFCPMCFIFFPLPHVLHPSLPFCISGFPHIHLAQHYIPLVWYSLSRCTSPHTLFTIIYLFLSCTVTISSPFFSL